MPYATPHDIQRIRKALAFENHELLGVFDGIIAKQKELNELANPNVYKCPREPEIINANGFGTMPLTTLLRMLAEFSPTERQRVVVMAAYEFIKANSIPS